MESRHRLRVLADRVGDDLGDGADRLDPARTWMVGNSPRSDILASVAAGLSAVYIPHPETWEFELADLPADHDRILHLARFADLPDYF